jgi:hypothetical protein
MKLASHHPSGALDFEVAPRLLENVCTPACTYCSMKFKKINKNTS